MTERAHGGSHAIEVRDARPGDADGIAGAHVEGWRVGYRGVVADDFLDHPDFFDIRRRGWERRLRDGPPPTGDVDNRIFVAVADGDVVGFGHAGREAQAPPGGAVRGEIYGFYVHPARWGTGVADALMDSCLDELGSRFDRAVLWTLRDNPRSRRFYERHGWSCGTGGEVLIESWDGPAMAGLPRLGEPLHNIQFRIDLC